MRGVRLAAGLAAVAVLFAAGCDARVDVAIAARGNGSGTVSVALVLDRDAVVAAGGIAGLRGQLRMEDLGAAGWAVTGPAPQSNGGARLTAVKRFSSADELGVVMTELAGEDGAFRDFRLEQKRDLVQTKTVLRGVVDMRFGVAGFGDAELARLTGSPVGVDPAALRRRLERDLDEVFTFTVRASLPGDERAQGGGPPLWNPRLGASTEVEAEATSVNAMEVGALAATVGAALGLIALLLVRGRRARPSGVTPRL